MKNKVCILGQIVSIVVILVGVAIAALAHVRAIESNNFVIGMILLIAAFLVFCIFFDTDYILFPIQDRL